MTELETERLSLRPYGPDDAALMLQLIGDPRVFFWREEPGTLADAQDWIDRSIALREERKLGWWAVHQRSNDVFVGQCGLQILPGTEENEIGYHLVHDHWGNGYATEAARAVLDHGFQELHLDRITAVVRPDNTASLRVMEKLAMPYIDNRLHTGITHRFFALTRDDYIERLNLEPDDKGHRGK